MAMPTAAVTAAGTDCSPPESPRSKLSSGRRPASIIYPMVLLVGFLAAFLGGSFGGVVGSNPSNQASAELSQAEYQIMAETPLEEQKALYNSSSSAIGVRVGITTGGKPSETLVMPGEYVGGDWSGVEIAARYVIIPDGYYYRILHMDEEPPAEFAYGDTHVILRQDGPSYLRVSPNPIG